MSTMTQDTFHLPTFGVAWCESKCPDYSGSSYGPFSSF